MYGPEVTDHVVLGMEQAELRAMIRERAYELSRIRASEHLEGSPEEDWRQATEEIAPFVQVEADGSAATPA